MRRCSAIRSLVASLVLALVPGLLAADPVTLIPARDNTIIQQSDPNAQLSNGEGDIFVGRTNQDGQDPPTISIRRGLIYFDVVSGLPEDITVTGVTLTMRDMMGMNGDQTTVLRRVLQDWGEGGSEFPGGIGAPAEQDDATWLYRFFNAPPGDPESSPAWTTPGGDFSAVESGSAVISDDEGGGKSFSWVGSVHPQMIADVQDWLDHPGNNFGWVLIGNEAQGQTAKRLNSRDSGFPPKLEITFHLSADLNVDGWVDIFDVGVVSENWMDTGAPGIPGDANRDGTINIFDVGEVSEHWNPNTGGGSVAVPEPATWLLLATGIVLVGLRRMARG